MLVVRPAVPADYDQLMELAVLSGRGFTSLLAMTPFLSPARADNSWATIEAEAKGQTVYFNAWAGSQNINAYLQWAGAEVRQRFGIT